MPKGQICVNSSSSRSRTVFGAPAGQRRLACAPDGLGHIGRCVVKMIADRRGPPGARYFQEYVSPMGAYLR
ncbi:hypothetical protein SO694_00028012 [Aureococcus anophagefferens]|uniref:Uncharacterized protein n=1 Tax=Aureococcus anophagefferens TaxID=44056 RepID=A0ABR1FVH4_AURAN